MRLPLSARWRLSAEGLSTQNDAPSCAFPDALTLPGASELAEYADLIGDEVNTPAANAPFLPLLSGGETEGATLCLPCALPENAEENTVLAREVDFGMLSGDHATLSLGLLAGRGEVWLGGERIGAFADGPLTLDVTKALGRARVQTLELRFDATRPAGTFGPAMLRVSRFARLSRVAILPDARSLTMGVRAHVRAQRDGEYLLRVTYIPAPGEALPARQADTESGETPLVRELSALMSAGEERALELTMDAPADRFAPGKPYAAPLIRVQLWLRAGAGDAFPGALCDEEALLCGYHGPAPRFWLPLTASDCATQPDALVKRLQDLHIDCVSLPHAAPEAIPEALLLALTRAGIGVRVAADADARERLSRYPCLTFIEEDSPCAGSADIRRARLLAPHALCGMIAYPRDPAPDIPLRQLLAEAAGHPIAVDEADEPDDPDNWSAANTRQNPDAGASHAEATLSGDPSVLAWLRAVLVRLRAEAMRQGMPGGPLCLPGEWEESDVADALRTALAGVHLSALPLYGAWWTRSHFSASLHAFVPATEGGPTPASPEPRDGLIAVATLETEDGEVLASVRVPCPPGSGRLGLIEATLPDRPCVLTLHTRLMRGDTALEESVLPVYVGERGPLECAF